MFVAGVISDWKECPFQIPNVPYSTLSLVKGLVSLTSASDRWLCTVVAPIRSSFQLSTFNAKTEAIVDRYHKTVTRQLQRLRTDVADFGGAVLPKLRHTLLLLSGLRSP